MSNLYYSSPVSNRICKICGNKIGNQAFLVKEMMFGFRDEFLYIMCIKCGCLQLHNNLENMSKYYPSDYYSFTKMNIKEYSKPVVLLNKIKTLAFLSGFTIFKSKYMPDWVKWKWKVKYGFNLNSKILDIGCGTGLLLCRMHNMGFSNLTGIDPLIEEDVVHFNKIRILKKQISDVTEKFDFIMLNHSFEHLNNPLEALKNIYSVTKKNGIVLIRIPLVSSYAWRKYKTNWVQLDAPRHFFLHSVDSMRILIKEAGFSLKELFYDSTAFQFVGSEQYLRNISMINDEKSIYFGIKNSIFTYEDIKNYNLMAERLNSEMDGDQACFLICKE